MRKWSHELTQHFPPHWPPTPTQTSHDASVAEEGQAEPNLTWRVAEEPQNLEEVAEPDGQRHEERYKEARVSEHGLTTPAAEP